MAVLWAEYWVGWMVVAMAALKEIGLVGRTAATMVSETAALTGHQKADKMAGQKAVERAVWMAASLGRKMEENTAAGKVEMLVFRKAAVKADAKAESWVGYSVDYLAGW
jgi:hypothetical protein